VKIGARPVVLEPDEHDRLVAFTSHVPQLLSTALASVLADVKGSASVAGPGVMGLTRLAMSPFGVWRDILLTNQQHIDEAMAALMAKLSELRGQISSASMEAEFERAGAAAKFLKENQRG
jgi:prephenate dehydrogenase